MTRVYGYVRAPSAYQSEEGRLNAMAGRAVPAKNIYIDKASGKDSEREQYRRMAERLCPGDLLFIVKHRHAAS